MQKINLNAPKDHDEGNISDKSFEDAQESFSSARAQFVRAEVFLRMRR